MADDEEASTIESFKSIENHEISGMFFDFFKIILT